MQNWTYELGTACIVCQRPLDGHSTAQLDDCRYMMQTSMVERVYGTTEGDDTT
jgi:hypothetical protein